MASTVTGCVSICAFASLLGIPVGIESSSVGINICATTAIIKQYRSVNNKRKNKHNKIVLKTKPKI